MRGRSTADILFPKGLLLALLVVSGCSRGANEPPDEVPTFLGSVDLEFGENDGDDPYLFTRIGSIVADPGGRLIVADLQSHEVRVFGPEGRGCAARSGRNRFANRGAGASRPAAQPRRAGARAGLNRP